ncbi:MAG: hypothetical protein AVDCRST_MAG34-792 [uncultured Nocardioidaceae bacterium]|uniref:PhoD-like phosphatase metallophosphatase domain-containing protein n=1 Tax=uncultured Nocardioidaceae bacterium TaxID=253824 RepID=A0A6J4LM44_9ACTN|nr:MAG: hypothetical protein AVDCRST_MAG34-792 [uncultured Nocardioidaceae bacterium]
MDDLTRRTALKGGLGAALAVGLSPLLSPTTAAAATANRVRVTTGVAFGSSTLSMPATFPAPGAGNLLLAVAGINGFAGTFIAPSGWRLALQRSGAAVSLMAMYRMATGTESETMFAWGRAASGGSWMVAEYAGVSSSDPLGPIRVPAYSDTARTRVVLDPPAAEANSIVLALFAIDSMNAQTAGDTGGVEFRPTAPGWNWVTTSYSSREGDCPGTALSEYGTPLATGVDLSSSAFRWLRSDQVAAATLQLNSPTPTLVSRWVGAVTGTGATVAVKLADATTARLKVATDPALSADVRYSADSPPDVNGAAKLVIEDLQPGTQYHYGVEVDGALNSVRTGSFRTSPVGGGSFTLAFASCCSKPAADIFTEIRGHDPDLLVHLGDLHYGNIAVNDAAAFRAKYDQALASAHQGPLYANVPTVYTWSDHDFGANGSSVSRPAAQAAYRQCVPSYPLPSATGGIYHSFVYGRVRFVVTDNRSYKSPKSERDTASKTILGAEQKAWFKDVIAQADEPVILWANETPWVGPVIGNSDLWGSYNTERRELADHIRASGKNVAIISGDMHALAADDGTNSPGGIPVFQAACLYGSSSHKGGPYTHGPYPSATGVNTQQYGVMRVVDTGTEISLQFTGYERGRTAHLSYDKTYSATDVVPSAARVT